VRIVGYHKKMNSSSESGNVLFYIFIAVVLFAGLSFAVSQSGRGSLTQITQDRTRLAATEIIDYSDSLAKAVGIMRLRGTTLAALRFSHMNLSSASYDAPGTAAPENEVFNSEGGAMIYRRPPAETLANAATDYAFLAANAVVNIGTTCATASCADVLMAVPGITVEACDMINRIGGNTEKGNPVPVNANFNINDKFKGAMAAPTMINNAVLSGKLYGCFFNTADSLHYFYRVLWAQ
jgi:hypothetical protein